MRSFSSSSTQSDRSGTWRTEIVALIFKRDPYSTFSLKNRLDMTAIISPSSKRIRISLDSNNWPISYMWFQTLEHATRSVKISTKMYLIEAAFCIVGQLYCQLARLQRIVLWWYWFFHFSDLQRVLLHVSSAWIFVFSSLFDYRCLCYD